jgi:hypothetical protein
MGPAASVACHNACLSGAPEKRTIRLEYLPQQHWLHAILEKMPDPSSVFCTQWNVIMKVTLNSSDVSTEQKVEGVGSCL